MRNLLVYVNGFWKGFVDKTDANHIEFFENIFKSTTVLANYQITTDINEADVLFESVFDKSLVDAKKWKYKIHFSGEPFANNHANYDVVMDSENTQANVVDLPLFAYYIHGNSLLHKLLNRPIITTVPQRFCCFIVSNGKSMVRNKIFEFLNSYKKVESFGNFNNNMGTVLQFDYWTEEFRSFIKQYKFVLCFENTKKGTYSTEKIINPFVSSVVPIYWSSHHIKNIFNDKSIVFLENETNHGVQTMINKIIELDSSDEKYLEFVNQPIINNPAFWEDNYSIKSIAQKIDKVLL